MLYTAKYGKFRQSQIDGQNTIPIIPNLERCLLHSNQDQQDSIGQHHSFEFDRGEYSLKQLHNELMKRKEYTS